MKQRLNDSNLDRQLKRKMAEAESMPPAFGELFPAQPRNFRFLKSSNIFALSFLIMSVAISLSNQNGFSTEIFVSNSTILAEIQNNSVNNDYEYNEEYTFSDAKKPAKRWDYNELPLINFHEFSPTYKAEAVSFDKEILKLDVSQENDTPKMLAKENSQLAISKSKKPFAESIFPKNGENEKNLFSQEISAQLIENKEKSQLPTLASLSARRELVANNLEKLVVPDIEYNFIKSKQKKTGKRNWRNNLFVGVTSSVENTWILNQNTYDEFDGYEFAYKVDWGYQYGFRVGYNPERGVGFELGYVPKSTKGQRYEDIIHLKNTKREVDLEYAKIPFKLKWRHPLSQNNRISLNWELGGAYSILHTAYQNNNGKVGEITDRFRKYVWQANTGIMADFDLNERVFISAGLQGSISQDINAPKWQANDNYGKSHTFTWGLQLGISRRL